MAPARTTAQKAPVGSSGDQFLSRSWPRAAQASNARCGVVVFGSLGSTSTVQAAAVPAGWQDEPCLSIGRL
eukprot:1760086-Alexandrium_andersonii.AAC.1